MFQYRKRYEITCDFTDIGGSEAKVKFQYRKRYEITCDMDMKLVSAVKRKFQYRKRYEITCDGQEVHRACCRRVVSIPQAV